MSRRFQGVQHNLRKWFDNLEVREQIQGQDGLVILSNTPDFHLGDAGSAPAQVGLPQKINKPLSVP